MSESESHKQPSDKESKVSKEEVEEFMGKPIDEIQGIKVEKKDAAKPLEVPETPEEKKIKIPHEPIIAKDAPNASKATTFEVERPEEVEVTEEEKGIFFKALMNEVPFQLTLHMLGGRFPIKLRTRTSHEQSMIISVLDLLAQDGDDHNFIRATTILQEYILCVTLVEIGGKPFPTVFIDPDNVDLAAIKKNLERVVKLHIAPIGQAKLGLLLKAVRIFESKKLLMQEQCLNEDFWEPVD